MTKAERAFWFVSEPVFGVGVGLFLIGFAVRLAIKGALRV